MQIRDTPVSYGLLSRCLHWGMALLFLWQFAGMFVRIIVGKSPLTAFWVGTHGPIGALLLTLLVLRVLWAFANRRRRPGYEAGLKGRLARVGHIALYALMLVVPSLALLRQYGSGRGFAPFGIPLMERTGERIEWMMAPANALHGLLAWSLLALVAGHIVMVIVHRFVWRDGVAARMLGRGDASAR